MQEYLTTYITIRIMHSKQTIEDRKCGLRLLRMGCILTTSIVKLHAFGAEYRICFQEPAWLSDEHIKQLDAKAFDGELQWGYGI